MFIVNHFFVNSKGNRLTQFFGLVFFFVLSSGFLYSQTSPTVTLTDTDADNILAASDTVTITASFSEVMTATPTISISGAVSPAYMFFKDGVSSYIPNANFSATSTGTRSDVVPAGNPGGYVLYEGVNFGTQVKISKDGSTLVTNSHGGRMIYIYRKENGSWALKQSIYGGDRDTDGIYGYSSSPITYTDSTTTDYTEELVELYFGAQIDISEDGNIIAVGSADKVAATDGDLYIDNSDNKLFIYENIGNNKWELTFESNQGGEFSFYHFDLSDDGTSIAGLWPRRQNSSDTYIEILNLTNLRTGSASVTQQTVGYKLNAQDIWTLSEGDIVLSGDKLTLAQIGRGGEIYVWTRASEGNNFNRSANKTITQPNYDTDVDVEHDLAISYNGEYIAYSSTKRTNASRLNVFKKDSGGNWSQFGTTLTDPQLPSIDSNFGFSVDISGDGKVIAVGSPNKNRFYETVSGNESNLSKPSYVYFYKYTENGFVYNSVITSETSPHITSIGYDVSLSYTGEDFVIGNSPFDPYHSGTNGTNEHYDDVYRAKDYINFSSSTGKKQNSTFAGSLGIFSGISSSYEYNWDVDSGGTPSSGTYYATVAGTASATSIAYSGTDSITFTIDSTPPTVAFTDTVTDINNVISTTLSPTNTVTITASFSKSMAATPTISITGVVTNVVMTQISGTNSYTYNWNTSTPTLAAGAYSVTVSGTDTIGNAYAGTDSITYNQPYFLSRC